MLRTCKKCGTEKTLDQFIAAPKCKEGRTHTCKACQLLYQQKRALEKKPLETRPRFIAKKLLAEGLKRCHRCEEIKPLADYWKNSRWAGGDGHGPYCKACRQAKWQAYKDGNRERIAEYNKAYRATERVQNVRGSSRRRRAAENPRNVMLITLRHGLRRRPTENPATIDDLMAMWQAQDGLCAITGIRMTWAQGKVLPTSISLDRIDHNGGYSKDNLRLICHAVNAFKGQMTDDEMFRMALAIVANMKKPKLRLVS